MLRATGWVALQTKEQSVWNILFAMGASQQAEMHSATYTEVQVRQSDKAANTYWLESLSFPKLKISNPLERNLTWTCRERLPEVVQVCCLIHVPWKGLGALDGCEYWIYYFPITVTSLWLKQTSNCWNSAGLERILYQHKKFWEEMTLVLTVVSSTGPGEFWIVDIPVRLRQQIICWKTWAMWGWSVDKHPARIVNPVSFSLVP